jgi:hypothetical protein
MLPPNFLQRLALFAMVTLSTGLTACAAETDEEATLASSEEITSGTGIVPGSSIFGAKLGMTPTQVKAILGEPEGVAKNDGRIWWMKFHGGKTEMYFDAKTERLREIDTSSATPRTKEGIGIGSTKKAVDAVPNTMCFATPLEDSEDVVYIRKCRISSNGVWTSFFFPMSSKIGIEPTAKVTEIVLEKL